MLSVRERQFGLTYISTTVSRHWQSFCVAGSSWMRSIAADLYRLLFDAILLNPKATPHGWEGFYFVDNGEHTWYDISKEIGNALVDLGISDVAEPTPFTDEELVRTWGTVVRILCYEPDNRD